MRKSLSQPSLDSPKGSNSTTERKTQQELNKNQKDKKEKKKLIQLNEGIDIPKNVNLYRQLLKKPEMKESDIDWILKLRKYAKITPKKTINYSSPAFYYEDLEKYKKRIENDKRISRSNLKCNIQRFAHIVYNKAGIPLNNSQFLYETTLRFDKQQNHWRTLSMSPSESQTKFFGTYLPPVCKNSKSNMERITKMISHPTVRNRKIINYNGEKIKQNVVDYDFNTTLRSPSEHFPSSRYSDEYTVKNINVLRTTLEDLHSPSFSRWTGELRDYGVSKVNLKKSKE